MIDSIHMENYLNAIKSSWLCWFDLLDLLRLCRKFVIFERVIDVEKGRKTFASTKLSFITTRVIYIRNMWIFGVCMLVQFHASVPQYPYAFRITNHGISKCHISSSMTTGMICMNFKYMFQTLKRSYTVCTVRVLCMY